MPFDPLYHYGQPCPGPDKCKAFVCKPKPEEKHIKFKRAEIFGDTIIDVFKASTDLNNMEILVTASYRGLGALSDEKMTIVTTVYKGCKFYSSEASYNAGAKMVIENIDFTYESSYEHASQTEIRDMPPVCGTGLTNSNKAKQRTEDGPRLVGRQFVTLQVDNISVGLLTGIL